MPFVVSKTAFADLVEEALAGLPPQFAAALDEVAIEVADRPTPEQLRTLHLRPNDLLLGLYHGHPRTERSVLDGSFLPDVIHLFQEHIQAVSRTRDELVEQVRKTALHELGHHFGMTEKDLEELGYG